MPNPLIARLALIATLVSLGCTKSYYRYETTLRLTAAQRPADVADRWGEQTIAASEDGFRYSDELISATFVSIGGTFGVELANHSPHSVQLLWDEASYVDPRGTASGVASGETRFIDVGRSRPPTVIPPGSRVSETMIPRAHISGTTVTRFFPYADDPTVERGAELRLVLPFRVEGVVNEYTFIFSVDDVAAFREYCDALLGCRPPR